MSFESDVAVRRPGWACSFSQQPYLTVPRLLDKAIAPCEGCAAAGPPPRFGCVGDAELVPAAPTATTAMEERRRGCAGDRRSSAAAAGDVEQPPCADAAVAFGGGRPPRSGGVPSAGALPRPSLPRTSAMGAAARPTPPPSQRRTRSSSTGAFGLPRLAIPNVASAVAEHLNTPPRLRAVLRRLAAANAASHTSALEVWGSEEEDGENVASSYMPSAAARPPHAPPAYGRIASLPSAATQEDGGLPAAVLPARIVWRDDVRLTVEAAAAAAGRRQAGGVDAAGGGGCRGMVTHAASTAWAAIIRALWEGGMGGKAPHAEDGASCWLLMRAVVLVALALVWMIAL